MSYILDALKKSDKQRQQRHVPGLNTVQIELPPGRRKKASWPLPLAAIVLVNVVVILFLVLRQDQSVPEPQSVSHAPDRSQSETSQERPTDIAPQSAPELVPVSQEPIPADRADSEDTNSVAGMAEGEPPPWQERAGDQEQGPEEANPGPEQDGSAEAAQEIAPEVPSTLVPEEDFAIATELDSAEAVTPADEYFENQDLQQAQLALLAAPTDSSFSGPQTSLVKKALHIYQLPEDIQQQLPKIHIDAHLFYKDKPSSRFASVNGKIMREGHSLTPNLKVAEITTKGVIFSYQKYLFYVSVF